MAIGDSVEKLTNTEYICTPTKAGKIKVLSAEPIIYERMEVRDRRATSSKDVYSPYEEEVIEASPIEPPLSNKEKAGKRNQIITTSENVLRELSPFIRAQDVIEARRLSRDSELSAVIEYLRNNIPDVEAYLSTLPDSASDSEKIAAIKYGLKRRMKPMEFGYDVPPIEIEEARQRQEEPKVSLGYRKLYIMKAIPRPKSTKVKSTAKSKSTKSISPPRVLSV